MKKKKGSTLLTVTIFTAVIISVAAVSMTVVANDYKMKITESKKTANLYGAESGLNMAYNVLVKVFNYAIEVANDEVLNNFDENQDLELSQNKMNEFFQRAFIETFEKEDYVFEDSNPGTLLEIALDHQVYPVFNDDSISYEQFDFSEASKLDIQVEMEKIDSKLIFTFTSDFASSDQSTQSNERQVSVKYSIYVPTYQGAIKENRSEVIIKNYPVFSDSVVNIDQNASLTGNVSIDGSMRVKGNAMSTTDRVYTKYINGISLTQGSLNVTKDLITNETLSLNIDSTSYINGDIYARNIYLGKLQQVEGADTNAHLVVSGSVLLDNDLAVNVKSDINGTKSTVQVNNLYGLNDKNVYDSNGDKVRESSSLIVNSDGATVQVLNETYLSGVAYIDTDGAPYQTGESVAVKGNYLIYTEILPGYEDRVQLKYYSPLLLIDSIDGNSSLSAKTNYFVTSVQENGELELSDGGVSLNPAKTYTIGASVSNGNVLGSTLTLEKQNEMKENKKSYASQVFNMGMSATESDYTSGLVKKSVSNQIDFSSTAFSTGDEEFNHNYGKVVLNNNSDITLVIESTGDLNKIVYVDSNGVILKTFNDVEKAFIVTNGDVILKGNVSLTGNIISAGNLVVDSSNQSTGDITLMFDKDVTQHIIAANYNELKQIFKNDLIHYDETKVEITHGIILDELETKYFAEDYIKMGRWQLLK